MEMGTVEIDCSPSSSTQLLTYMRRNPDERIDKNKHDETLHYVRKFRVSITVPRIQQHEMKIRHTHTHTHTHDSLAVPLCKYTITRSIREFKRCAKLRIKYFISTYVRAIIAVKYYYTVRR